MNQKYIITGAPGTGKTSIINQLKKEGYYCIDENSRKIIEQQIKNKGNVLPWKDQIAFETEVSKKRFKQYISSPKDCVCFFDRSNIDCVAYLKLNNLKPTAEMEKEINESCFNKSVFYTPIWECIYITDNERKENIEIARMIEKTIIKTYTLKGYKLIEVPKLSVKERVDFIISRI